MTSTVSMFRGCGKLLSIPDNLLMDIKHPSINGVDVMFGSCTAINTTVYDMWNVLTPTSHVDVFLNCDNIENYNSIHASWGGV